MGNLASYGGYRSSGFPLVVDGVLDLAKVARLARYGTVVIHANTLHLRPDIVPALRAAGAKRILPYVLLRHWWYDATFTPKPADTSLNAELQRVYLRTGAFLPNPQLGDEIDWTNAAMAKGVADLYAMLAGSGLYDGIFIDYAYSRWLPNASTVWNNMNLLSSQMRRSGGTGFLLVANGGDGAAIGADASMHEGFPQPFTDFDAALALGPWAWLKCEDTNPRAGRFGYGTALLTGATFCWGPQRPDSFDGDRWLPEFEVNLGAPRGSYLRHESGVYMRWFEKGVVMVNPTWDRIEVDLLVQGHAFASGVPARRVVVPAMDALVMVRA